MNNIERVQNELKAIEGNVTSGKIPFAEAANSFAKLSTELADLRKDAQKEAVATVQDSLKNGIIALLDNLGVADLIGEPVTSLTYKVDDDGSTEVKVNIVRGGGNKLSIRRPRKVNSGDAYVSPSGEYFSTKRMMLANADNEVRSRKTFDRWPTNPDLVERTFNRLEKEGWTFSAGGLSAR